MPPATSPTSFAEGGDAVIPPPPPPHPPPVVVVVMGVSGCGKSTLGAQLAAALGVPFIEGDGLHPPHNVALMAAGTPLTDADRADWLLSIAARLGQAHAAGQGLVVSCSALKRRYREQLRAACPGLRLVHLHGSADQLRRRLQGRTGHYMPASLLDSQLSALQPPGADENALVFNIALSVDQITASALAQLQRERPP